MTETLHANIFFFITALAVILITAGILWLLFYVIPIARDIRALTSKIRRVGDRLEDDVESLRHDLHAFRLSAKEEGVKGKVIIDLALAALARKFRPKQPRKKPEHTESVE